MGLARRDASSVLNGSSSGNAPSLEDKVLVDACTAVGPLGEKMHPLYGHGVCKWPGCEVICDDFQAFLK